VGTSQYRNTTISRCYASSPRTNWDFIFTNHACYSTLNHRLAPDLMHTHAKSTHQQRDAGWRLRWQWLSTITPCFEHKCGLFFSLKRQRQRQRERERTKRKKQQLKSRLDVG